MRIEIKESDEQVIPVQKILNRLRKLFPEIENCFFSIQFINGTSVEDFLYLDFEQKVNHSDLGIILNFEEVMTLFDKIYEIYELFLLIEFDKRNIKRYKANEELSNETFASIEYFDGGLIEINTMNNQIFNDLSMLFDEPYKFSDS